ncbi:uncharacterized protein LOC133838480 [Drosophila sulfurigaster albostrigata]|uniref:uncharacterized protein LOC133838480 n=1 Tax=Drosophila sulfurigaster albostrigata TaxID=89887 RepID=UPI002D21C9A6|nr:uncharacterized protein LOC133838480 [Drosophila sulfurigaster albostrigata]
MVAIKLLFLTVFTLTNLLNGVILKEPEPLRGVQYVAAENRLKTALNKVIDEDGPEFKLKIVYSVTNKEVSVSYLSVDTYNVDLFYEGTVRPCKVKIWTRPWTPWIVKGIKIVCDKNLQFEKDF